jgi:hypothetical protein
MVSRSDITILVDLLDVRLKFFLAGSRHGMFFSWLQTHTGVDIKPGTFKDQLMELLLGMKDNQAIYAEVLIIDAEIIWTSQKEKYEIRLQQFNKKS